VLSRERLGVLKFVGFNPASAEVRVSYCLVLKLILKLTLNLRLDVSLANHDRRRDG
jgi:hypothetical protein